MIREFPNLSLKEKKVTNNFLSLELSKNLKIKYPSPKVQDLFKLNGTNNWSGKKKQKERKEKGK
ncbi:hypothetical protein LCGC14_0996590 [marine sediment metagenome]|uniref:Uncharacterized protein n=1 Tax=marine sediment metagenome TaxID=412755 RepID=A0A0F9N8X7_9ZZZZ